MTTVAAIQMACSPSATENRAKAKTLVRKAAAQGAQIILLSELFETPYFCKTQDDTWFAGASSWDDHPAASEYCDLAGELGIVLPISFFEKAGNAYFNSVAVIDADGSTLGLYRKIHIPQGPGYEEKYFFSPGDKDPKVWETAHGRIGIGICWDQWFPEEARIMALKGAQIIFYPTAIGSEPEDPEYDSSAHWTAVQCGHAAANMVPIVAANRIGTESQGDISLTFYGSSFIADQKGSLAARAGRDTEEILTAAFDFKAIETERASWGLFRDRRPERYGRLGGY